MSGITDILKSKGDGVTAQTKAGFKAAGLDEKGGYEVPPPPPPPPESNFKGQVGSTVLENEKKLEDSLMQHRKITREQAKKEIADHKKQKGYR